MKQVIFSILSIIAFFSTAYAKESPSRMVGKILNEFANEQQKKNRLSVAGMGSSIPSDIRGFCITLVSEQKMDIQQARKLYVELAESLLAKINQNEQIRPYLHNYPFDIKNLDLMLSLPKVNDPQKRYVSLVLTAHGKLDYSVYDPVEGILKDLYKESYEEALRIVRSSN